MPITIFAKNLYTTSATFTAPSLWLVCQLDLGLVSRVRVRLRLSIMTPCNGNYHINKLYLGFAWRMIQNLHLIYHDLAGWWRWALVRPDGAMSSWLVGVSASVNFPLQNKVQKFFSGTSSPGWSRKKGPKTVVCYHHCVFINAAFSCKFVSVNIIIIIIYLLSKCNVSIAYDRWTWTARLDIQH